MSIAGRLTAAILLLVVLTAGLSWLAVTGLVLRPFADDVHQAWLREVAYIADELESGVHPRRLAHQLDVRIKRFDRPLPPRWRVREVEGHRLAIAPGPRNVVVIDSPRGRVAVARDLDPDRPRRRLGPVFALIAALIVTLALIVARMTVRPLRRTTAAMARMGEGDLALRLEEAGPAEVRAASRAFNQLADRVADLLTTERRLLAGISHELRTPLTRLRLELELLRDAGVDPRRLDRMQGDVEQLDELIGETLQLSRLQLGAAPLTREPVELLELARRVADDDISVRGATTTLSVDRLLVEHALQNLLQNARKYAPGAPIAVHVHPTGFDVRDAGPGVPEADLPHLFDPFYRTTSGSRRAEGHGLGLMLVRTVAELHGGRVWAQNLSPGLLIAVRLLPEAALRR